MNRRTALALTALAPVALVTPAGAATLRLAAPALDGTALMFYAQHQGFLKNAGLDTDVQAMSNGEAVTLALIGGAVDVGCSEVVSLILAYRKGIPLTLIAGCSVQTPTAASGMLFARRDSTIASAKDLNGKTIAVVGLNGFAQYGTQNWIDANGGDSKSAKFVQLAGAQIPVALKDGRIDAAFVPEPFVAPTKDVSTPLANPMAAIAPTFLTGAHFCLAPFATSHIDEIRELQGALRDTAAWANRNQQQTAVILEQVAHVSPDLLARSVRSSYAEEVRPEWVQPMIDLAAKYGGFASFPATQMIFAA